VATQEYRSRISDKEVAYLVRGANSVRKLIRVKIADENDLNQARVRILAYLHTGRDADASGKSLGVAANDHSLLPSRGEGSQ
jgi:hypothetical protein